MNFDFTNTPNKVVLANQLKGILKNPACEAIHDKTRNTLKQILSHIKIKK